VAKTQSSFSGKFTAKPSSKGIDPRSVRNEILLSLPPKECAAVLSELEFVEMRAYDLLNEMGESIEFCYFMNSGMTSILTIMGDGKGVEVGLTGKDGFIGLPLVVGLKTSATRAIVQITGSAFRLSTAQFVQVLATGQTVESLFAATGNAGHAGCRLQSRSQRRTAACPMVADESGPGRRRCSASDPGIPFPHAGNAKSECDGSGGHPSKSGPDQIFARHRNHCGPPPVRGSSL
jgi:hypothetical protein